MSEHAETDDPHVEVVIADGVMHLLLCRPNHRNPLSAKAAANMRAALAGVRDRRDVRVVVVRGAGGMFCAGGDVKDMHRARDPRTLDELSKEFAHLMRALADAPQVVIAAVEGLALGGGFGLVCAADIAISTRGARFGLPEVAIGMVPAQIAPFVVRRIGWSHARRLALSATRIDEEEALRLGLVHELVDDAPSLDRAVARWVDVVRRTAPSAIARTKSLFCDLAADSEGYVSRAATAFSEAALSADAREGIAAVLEKREPRWHE